MKQFKFFVDIEEEEEYLNEMANSGHILKEHSIFGRYHFIEDDPQNLHYKIDYRDFKSKDDYEDYLALFEDAGWNHVCGTKSSGNQYFLPQSEKINDDIFSDVESKAGRYLRFRKAMISCSICFVLCIVAIMASVNFNLSQLGFLTPDLWDKQGSDFWNAFFFELPFVCMRILPVIIIFTFTIIYGLWAAKAKKLYEQAINQKQNL